MMMEYLAKIWNNFKSFWCKVDSHVIQEYRTVFKGGVFLLGVTIASLSQIYPKLIEMDYKARLVQFQVEAQEKKKLSEIGDCHTLSENIDKCLYAKYQLNSNVTSFRLAAWVTVFCFYTGVLLLLAAMYGFVEQAKKTDGPPENTSE
ncbi:hypothetical protein [Isoalcanivorax indicus]|uniref:hypothetical protein n=1 Tax=Isoalcanivorax indicus TaxID=2202653 RepID=UPI000DB9CEE5|nr:hypothetical protein [Isoalcanivorax indicus]